MVDWVGLTVPLAYLSILVGSLATFSSLYRKRKAGKWSQVSGAKVRPGLMLSAKSISLEPWFGQHLQRDIYLSLLHLEPDASQEKSPAVPDSVLKAALLQRAAEDIRRILAIRSAKPALANLLARGSVGDDLWQRFLRAEKEIEAELRDVVEEVILPHTFPLLCRSLLWVSLTLILGQRTIAELGSDHIPECK